MTVPRIMGIVNVTPDSFSDGGQFTTAGSAIEHALRLVDQGAHILDIGGESTRPGAEAVSLARELERVIPVIEGIRERNAHIDISIDTTKSAVARAAIAAGATMVNDVSAGRFDPDMLATVAEASVPYVAMHMQGAPRTMQQDPQYTDVVAEVRNFLLERSSAAHHAGIREVYVDVGIGFGKSVRHNLELLQNINKFSTIAAGQVLGISRKRFIGALAGIERPEDRDGATALLHALLLPANVSIIRVHNVEMVATVIPAQAGIHL
ncbi:MAG: dihydropteroate synthase [Candidatus Kapabacteria bacterium]|nr:dihydropteroate synthase [Candidatus Kapabacteria bacterium]